MGPVRFGLNFEKPETCLSPLSSLISLVALAKKNETQLGFKPLKLALDMPLTTEDSIVFLLLNLNYNKVVCIIDSNISPLIR